MPARIQIGSLRYFDPGDCSSAEEAVTGSVVLRYARTANSAAKTSATNATDGLKPPKSIPINKPKIVAKFTNVNPAERAFIRLRSDLELDSLRLPQVRAS